jgi:hypothetical protein
MPIVKSIPTRKFFKGNLITTSDQVIVSEPEYSIGNEGFIIVKDVPMCTIRLNPNNSDHVTIKSLTKVLLMSENGKIDEEFNEILLNKGTCVEMFFSLGNWYIMSSDGLKGV